MHNARGLFLRTIYRRRRRGRQETGDRRQDDRIITRTGTPNQINAQRTTSHNLPYNQHPTQTIRANHNMSSTNGNATALDVIIVVPSRSRRRPPTSSGSNNYQEGVIASSDFYVTFPSSSAVQYATNKRDIGSNTSSVATLQRWTSSFFSNTSSREFNESSNKASAKKPPESDHIVDCLTTNDPPRTTAISKAENAPIDELKKSLGNPKRGNVQVQINGRPIPGLQMNCRAYKNGESISKFVVGNGLRPPTESLEKLVNEGILNYGRNLIKYILLNDKNDRVSTAEAFLYLWSARDSVIVCDIDGTITKSDVRGVLDTVIQDNFQHIHKGVCRFFHEIINAYELDKDKSEGSEGGQLRFFYLSSRPISYISQTRKLLVGLSQQHERVSIGLPPGPIMCHRGSLSTVLHSELVLKNVYEFKADVLVRQIVLPFVAALGDFSIQSDDHSDEVSRRGSDLSELTANCADYRLFLCGFGNKSTDAKAYQLAGK